MLILCYYFKNDEYETNYIPLLSFLQISAYLAKDIEMINRSEADWVHIDIMDGVFVPNISFGFPVLKYVAKLTSKPLDVHLMIVNPEKFIPEVKALGATS